MSITQKTVDQIQIMSVGPGVAKLVKAILFLKKTDQHAYNKIIKYLTAIFVVSDTGSYNETDTLRGIWMTEGGIIVDGSYQYLSSLLLHEAHHIAQHRAGRPYTGAKAEKSAYKLQRRFLKRINYLEAVEWLDNMYGQKWWQHQDRAYYSQDINRKYSGVKKLMMQSLQSESKE